MTVVVSPCVYSVHYIASSVSRGFIIRLIWTKGLRPSDDTRVLVTMLAAQRGLKALRRLRLERLVLSVMGARGSTPKVETTRTKIEQRMVQELAQRAKSGKVALKAFNSIILKFPKIDESFEAVRTVFKKFDKDGSGTIDLEELKVLFKELQVNFTDEEVKSFHEASDMDSSKGIDFKEFIVLLSLVYFLGEPGGDENSKSRIGLPQLEATFETIVDAFVFFDSNCDGYVSKKELVTAINQASPGRHSDRIGLRRFEEMDWDKNGLVTFKEFLFAFTDWVGLEDEEEKEVNHCWKCFKMIHRVVCFMNRIDNESPESR